MAPKKAKTPDLQVKWRLTNLASDFKDKQVKGTLCMPSLPKDYKGEWVCPPVTLDLHADSKDTTYSLTIMRESCSRNILNAKLVIKDKSNVLAWVEPFTGDLLDYMETRRLGISDLLDHTSKFTLPTPNLRSVIRQVIKGLQDLRKSGHYHGGFSFRDTYYVMDTSGVIVKLCNFKKKGGTFNKNLAEDWWSVKNGLEEIREIAAGLRNRYPNMDLCQLDGLIIFLNNIAPINADLAFEAITRQPFFWGKLERKEFFIHEVALSLENKVFCLALDNAEFINSPWKCGGKLIVLFAAMNKYRAKLNKEDYNTGKKVDLVKFIAGLYTHEDQLETTASVDSTVETELPGLCYHLYALMPGANTVST